MLVAVLGAVCVPLALLDGRRPPINQPNFERLEEGMGLSRSVAAAVAPAVDTVIELVTQLSRTEGVRA